MYPNLQQDDICFVGLDTKPTYGSIICLKHKEHGELILHRVLSADLKLVKGDNSLYWDDMNQFNLVGVVHSIQRDNRTAMIKPKISHCLLSLYTLSKYPKVVRVLAKAVMRLSK